MVRVFIVSFLIAVFVIGGWAAPLFTYATEMTWNTYNNTNLKFSIDYPTTWGSSNDRTKVTEAKDSVTFDMMPHLSVTITPYGKGLSAETWAQAMKNDLMKNSQDELLQGVTKVEYNGEIGYRFHIFDSFTDIYTLLMYFDSPNGVYEAKFIGYEPIGGIPSPIIDVMLNTIKFSE